MYSHWKVCLIYPIYPRSYLSLNTPLLISSFPLVDQNKSDRLYLAGTVYYMTDNESTNNNIYSLHQMIANNDKNNTHPLFHDIVLSNTMLSDHAPKQYETAFDSLLSFHSPKLNPNNNNNSSNNNTSYGSNFQRYLSYLSTRTSNDDTTIVAISKLWKYLFGFGIGSALIYFVGKKITTSYSPMLLKG